MNNDIINNLNNINNDDMNDINHDMVTKWQNHLNYIDTQLQNMWSLMHYNTFIDKEVFSLKKQLNDVTSENSILKLKKTLECCEEDEPIKKKRKVVHKNINLLKNEYNMLYGKRSGKKYKFMTLDKRNILAIEIYKTLNTIEDIIKLKKHPNKFDFFDDMKFVKLYNIIPVLEELNDIIGMKNVKDKLFNSICFFLHSMNNKDEMNHAMIMGPPGVGKTTIAKIIGDLYLKLGFLENNTFVVAKRSDLIAKYLGQTAIKTQKVIDSAIGGVLFIDEVYSLGNDEKRDSFAKECIDTINLNMSRTDSPWLLIVGGYKEEIEKEFLSYNKGLERRFTVKLEIKEYSAEELHMILMKFVKEESWEVNDNSITVDDIKDNMSKFKYSGGDMRKLLQLAKENYSVRSMKENISLLFDNKSKRTLLQDDFKKSLMQFSMSEVKDKYFHQSMYS